jgi:Flp pilus assembly protein TadD
MTACAVLVALWAIPAARAQAPDVGDGVCKEHCEPIPGSGNNGGYVSRADAREYSRYVAAYNKARQLNLDAHKIGNEKGNWSKALSLYESALSYVNEALQIEPNDGDSIRLKRGISGSIAASSARLAVQGGDYDRAISLYRQAEEIDPDDQELWEQNIAWIESLQQKAQTEAQERAQAEAEAEAEAQARAQTEAAAEADARAQAEEAAAKQARADALWNQAEQLVNSGDFKSAEEAWRQIIALEPENSHAYNNLGLTLLFQKRLDEAEIAFRKTLELDVNTTTAELGLGDVLRLNGRNAEAETAYRKAIGLDPSNDQAELGLGLTLINEQRYTEAEEAYRKAVQLNPNGYLNELMLGSTLSDEHKNTEAEAVLRRAVELNPNDSTGQEILGYVFRDENRFAEAEASYRKAVALNPGDDKAEYGLGMSLWGQFRVADAEAAFRKAAELNPNDYDNEMLLGTMLTVENRPSEAEAAYRKALAAKPGDTKAQSALDSALRKESQQVSTAAPAMTSGETLHDVPNSGNAGSDSSSAGAGGGTQQKGMSEALSNRDTTTEGLNSGSPEEAAAGSRQIIDNIAPGTHAPPVDLRGVGKAPAVAALLSHIPQDDRVRNDDVIKTSVAWYSKLESDKAETQQKIADVQKQIDSKQGDPGILKIEQAQYTNDLQKIQQNQQTAQDAIKKQLVKLDLPWIENPAPPETKAKEKQP